MRFNSIRFKTSILYTLILGIILSVYSGTIFYEVRAILYHNLDESLKVKAREVGDIIHAYELSEKTEESSSTFLQGFFNDNSRMINKMVVDDLWHSEVKTLNLKDDYIHILTSKGRSILASENVRKEEEELFSQQLPFSANQIVFQDLKDKDHNLRAVNCPLLYHNRFQIIVQIATPLTSVTRTLNELMIFIMIAVGFILILTSFLGGIFARGVLTPVRKIAEAARGISYKDLNVRIEEKQSDEEIRYLIESFNTMLGRLEKSFGHINEFSSHVAHELKTPLAILRGEMELALSETQSVEEHRKVLEAGLEEVNRLIKIIKDLLLLANLDYRADIFKFEKIDLSEFMRDICENGLILANEKGINLTSEIPADAVYVNGDAVHLRRLFFNLLHNAVKFTSSAGKIHISLKERDRNAVISIVDTGVGITHEDLNRLFTKFFRAASKDQVNPEPGNGLGLSIAQSIAKAHQGLISVQSEINKGSVFTVTIPLI